MRPAIVGPGGYDMIPSAQQGRHCQMHSGLTACCYNCADPIVQGGHPFLQNRVRWIGQSRIDVARSLYVEQANGNIRIWKNKRG